MLPVLPRGLDPVCEADGTARFALSRFRDTTISAAGGMMHLELDFATLDPELIGAAATDGWDLRLAGFSAARARLRSHLPGLTDDSPLGPWSEARLSSRTLLVEDHLFDANTAQMLDGLLSSDAGDIEVEVEARYEGLEKALPVLVSGELAEVAALLRASAPSYLLAEGVGYDAIEAAILSAVSGTHSPFHCEQLSDETFAGATALRWRCATTCLPPCPPTMAGPRRVTDGAMTSHRKARAAGTCRFLAARRVPGRAAGHCAVSSATFRRKTARHSSPTCQRLRRLRRCRLR